MDLGAWLDRISTAYGMLTGVIGWFISGFTLVDMVMLAEKLVKRFEKLRTMKKHH